MADLRGHEGPITCVDIAGDEAFVVSGSDDTTVKVWSLIMACVITDYKVSTESCTETFKVSLGLTCLYVT